MPRNQGKSQYILVGNEKNAEKYKIKNVYCYNEADFIDYLNEYVFPEKKSVFVKNLGWTDFGRNLPVEYKDHPYFNF